MFLNRGTYRDGLKAQHIHGGFLVDAGTSSDLWYHTDDELFAEDLVLPMVQEDRALAHRIVQHNTGQRISRHLCRRAVATKLDIEAGLKPRRLAAWDKHG